MDQWSPIEIPDLASVEDLDDWAGERGLIGHPAVLQKTLELGMSSRENEEEVLSPKKSFPCPHCEERFDLKFRLKMHQLGGICAIKENVSSMQAASRQPSESKGQRLPFADVTPSVANSLNAKHHGKASLSSTTAGSEIRQASQHDYFGLAPPSQLGSNVQCPTCKQLFSRKDSLKRHTRSCRGKRTEKREMATNICKTCTKAFSRLDILKRHRLSCKGLKAPARDGYLCSKCGKKFEMANLCTRHEGACVGTRQVQFDCATCKASFSSANALLKHRATTHLFEREKADTKNEKNQKLKPAPQPGAPVWHCRRCPATFQDKSALYHHRMREHFQVGGGLLQRPWHNNWDAPWVMADGSENAALKETYEVNEPHILRPHQESPVRSDYNFPLASDFNIRTLIDRVQEIYDRNNQAFKINMSFGFILFDNEIRRYRYFVPHEHDPVLEAPFEISSRRDIEKLREKLEEIDLMQYLLNKRPNTKYRVVMVTNVHFFVFSLLYPLGNEFAELADYVKNHKAIITFDYDKRTKQRYSDQLCFFRCLSYHYHAKDSEQTHVREYFDRWVSFSRSELGVNVKSPFRGITTVDIPDLENCFKININLFHLSPDSVAVPVYKSRCRFQDDVNLDLHADHLSYITSLKTYSKKFQCLNCKRLFPRASACRVHQSKCSEKTKYRFPGKFYRMKKSIFDLLDEYGIVVENCEDRLFPWFIVFDFEAILQPTDRPDTEKIRWTQRHVPISVSICSNVEGYTIERCIVNTDPDELLTEMLAYMKRIVEKVAALALEKWEWVHLALMREIARWQDKQKQYESGDEPMDYGEGSGDEECTENFDEEEELMRMLGDVNSDPSEGDWDTEEGTEKSSRQRSPYASMVKSLTRLQEQFRQYCFQVPILGYNSSRYDLNLVKEKLAQKLNLHKDEYAFTIRRNNSYLCLANRMFRFLDAAQFLAAGTSYSEFLKAYQVEEKKGFFPYDYLDSPDKLNETSLPPLGPAWHSSLKGKSVLDDGVKSPEENYAWLQEVWIAEKMTDFADFLRWYNNRDVKPFVTGLSRMQRFYFERGIDVFKTTMSVPGVAREMLFKAGFDSGATFSLFDHTNSDVYDTLKRNIVGGPSIIMTRAMRAGVSYLREDPAFPCASVQGFDANSLYLWCLDQHLPCGPLIRRHARDGFKPKLRDRHMTMYWWMDHLARTRGWYIQHYLNSGREKRVGPYLADGYHAPSNTLLDYLGCYVHGHEHCPLTQHMDPSERLEKFQKTVKRRQFLMREGFKIEEIWECEFSGIVKKDKDLRDFIEGQRPEFFRRHKGSVKPEVILDAVRRGKLYGMVEVDIGVPDQWAHGISPYDTTMSPYDYFKEMCPLFGNAEVKFEQIGEHMREYAREFGVSETPRRLLIGGLKARRMLVATPLLKWYLEKGLRVSRVYQVYEYTPVRCFKEFVRQVSDARRRADVDPDQAVLGTTMKTLGNSGYGSLLMSKDNFRKICYVSGEREAGMKVNDPLFRHLTVLDPKNEYFEFEMAKSLISLDMPIQIGYYVLQLAKLRMLQFYYDFMDRHVGRERFEYLFMDTDSAYLGLVGESLKDAVLPHMQLSYATGLECFCTDEEIPADANYRWFPRTCCEKHELYDKRTPGLFKLEYKGEDSVGLASKTYVVGKKPRVVAGYQKLSASRRAAIKLLHRVIRRRPKRFGEPRRIGVLARECKFSCKGINKHRVKNPMSTFRKVIETQKPVDGCNAGFRVMDNAIYTYTQIRRGFSYFYIKRRVHDDGIHTSPLDLVLSPSA